MAIRTLKVAILIFLIFSVVMLGIAQFVRPLLAEHFDSLSNVAKSQALGVYVITASTAIAFAVPVAGLVMSAAGFLFGTLYGTLLGVVCMVTGSFVTFIVTRKFLREKMSRKYGPEMRRVDEGLKKYGLRYLLFLRVSPFPPVSVTNFAMGVTGVSIFNFLWVSILGLIPAAFLYAYLGSTLASLNQ